MRFQLLTKFVALIEMMESLETGRPSWTCNERDVLAITVADESSYSSCFLADEWSWKLSFQECLVSKAELHVPCAGTLRVAAFPDFISPDTCEVGQCDVKYAMQRAVSTIASAYTNLGPGQCSSRDLALLSALSNSANGSLPSAPPANLSSTCTSCLALETACPSAQTTDVCYPSNASAACFGCQQINAAKQMAICAVASGTNPDAYDCSDRDISRLTNFRLKEAIECFSDIIGWQGAAEACFSNQGVSPRCSSYVAKQVFYSAADQECVNAITPTNEVSTNTCLVSMWMRGIASVLNTTAEVANMTRTQTCTDSDVGKLTTVTNNTNLASVATTLSAPCQTCIGDNPVTTVQTGCATYCNSTNAEYRNITWACSACMQFESAKVLTNCSIGAKFASAAFGYSGILVLAIAVITLLI